MLRGRFNLWLALSAALLTYGVNAAETFESIGEVVAVDVAKNIIQVDEQLYSLPNSTLANQTPAIFQLQPGTQIGFSGRTATPYFIINSVFIYPKSAQQSDDPEQKPHRPLLRLPK